VRRLFEQLRLKGEAGDAPGKDRLERVPALSKRNFANLASDDSLAAIREAWRLVDFLEGARAGELSIHARAALRVTELDRKLAACRESVQWRQAAEALRRALGAEPAAHNEAKGELVGGDGAVPEVVTVAPISAPAKPRRVILPVVAGVVGSGAIAALVLTGQAQDPAESPSACLALEHASPAALAAHWEHGGARIPRPALQGDASQHVYQIDEPANGGPVRSIWTTSAFSYAERTAEPGPGGGRSDFRLRVGGWGDTYLSLLQVPVPTNRLVQRATIQLTVLGDDGSSRPTTMTLRAISDNWSVGSGPNNRLWWHDCPHSGAINRHLPPPGPRDSIYEIEITDLYNMWALGLQAPYGIILEPEHIGSWGPDRPHYSNFNTFYSTRALDPAHRPRLVLTY
jgi:hypothetical protein